MFGRMKKKNENSSAEQVFQAGLLAYDAGNFAEAAEKFQQAANENHLAACERLSLMYANGQYFNVDDEKEEHYLRIAADGGYAFAQAGLALLCDPAFHDEKTNRIEAAHYLHLALQQDEVFAEGIALLTGLCGRDKDPVQAAECFRQMLAEKEDDAVKHALLTALFECRNSYSDIDCDDEWMALLEDLAKRGVVSASTVLARIEMESKEDGEPVEKEIRILQNAVAKKEVNAMACLGRYYYDHDKEKEGLALLEQAAALNNSEALCFLAQCKQEESRKYPDDSRESVNACREVLQNLEKAAALKNTEALMALGYLTEDLDPQKAASCFFNAGLQDNGNAMTKLGKMYSDGVFPALNNPQLAIHYYHEAINRGDIEAHVHLGMAFLGGTGVDPEPFACLGHFMAAAKKGNPDGMFQYGKLLRDGYCFIGFSDEEEGMKWIEKAAELDQPDAIMYLWDFKRKNGEEFSESKVRELDELLVRAAELENDDALLICGVRYLNGYGVEVDHQKALQHFVAAAGKENMEAVYWLGFMYAHGIGVSTDAGQARIFFKQAAEKDNMRAQYEYGKILYEEKEYIEAYHFLKKACEQEHPKAMKLLAQMYEKGFGVAANPEVARQILEHAQEVDEDFF